MTYSTLASIVKYPYASILANGKHKFGFFDSEAPIFARIADELGIIRLSASDEPLRYVRYPLVWLVEAADDICYLLMDLEDAHKLKLISTEKTVALMMNFIEPSDREHAHSILNMVTDVNEQVSYLRSKLVGILIDECTQVFLENQNAILEGSFTGSLINHISNTPKNAYAECAELSKEKIYRSRDVLEVELAGFRIISTLLDRTVHYYYFFRKHLYSHNLYKAENRNTYLDAMVTTHSELTAGFISGKVKRKAGCQFSGFLYLRELPDCLRIGINRTGTGFTYLSCCPAANQR